MTAHIPDCFIHARQLKVMVLILFLLWAKPSILMELCGHASVFHM